VRWAGYVMKFKKIRKVQEIFVSYIDGNRASDKHKQRWDNNNNNNIKMDLKAIGLGLYDVRHVTGHKAFYKIRGDS